MTENNHLVDTPAQEDNAFFLLLAMVELMAHKTPFKVDYTEEGQILLITNKDVFSNEQ